MTEPARILRHEVVLTASSFEVRFSDGRRSQHFYFGDEQSRRIRPGMLTADEALEQARALARAEWDKAT